MERVTGKSEAKAVLKGKLRAHRQVWEDNHAKKIASIQNGNIKRNKNFAKTVYQEHLENFGELLLTESVYKRPSTWHWRSLFSGIEFELAPVEDVGNICRYIVCYFDSRKYINEDTVQGYNMWFSDFYFHEHFLERGILRFNTKTIGEIGAICYPLISWMIKENVSPSRFDQYNYFVFREFVVVTQKLTKSRGVVFKTILLTDLMNNEQKSFYFRAYEQLNKDMNISAVMVNQNGELIRKVDTPTKEMSLGDIVGCSNWLYHFGQKEDIRKFAV